MKSDKLDVLFIAVGFSGIKMASDKNFYINLIDELCARGVKIKVISFVDPIESDYKITDTNNYEIIQLRRPYHYRKAESFWKFNQNFTSYNHHHKNFAKEYGERFLCLFHYRRYINKIIKDCNPDTIHFLDTFPLPTISLAKKKVILTHGKFDIKNKLIFNLFLKVIYCRINEVILFNKVQLQFIPNVLLSRKRFHIQPWGCKAKTIELSDKSRQSIMQNPNNILVLWSGFLQQIGYNDFLYAQELARFVVSKFNHVEFVFSFKPECKISIPSNENQISYVQDGNLFQSLFNNCDIFFSPLIARNTIISPPLTWIEALSLRKCILTTDVLGIDSYFKKDHSILTFVDKKELFDVLDRICFDKGILQTIAENAFDVFNTNFTLNNISNKYLDIYNIKTNNNGTI